MSVRSNQNVYERLGLTPVINACGIYTDLGGSMIAPEVWEAMEEANQYFLNMPDLLDHTGTRVAELMGAEAGRITPGASAAIALSVSACMTGNDGTKWEQLPSTQGMKNEVLMFRSQLPQYKYASCVHMPGCKVIAIGEEEGVDASAIAPAVTENSACVMVPQHLTDWYDNPPQNLEAICSAAHEAGIPVVVDAAYLNYPLGLFKCFTHAGADLVCFSAKYFYGPNAGGFVVGREELMNAVSGLDFTRFESGTYRSFGRPFKMGRYEVIAVMLALEEWLRTDHDARWRSYADRVRTIHSGLPDLEHIRPEVAFFTMDERLDRPEDAFLGMSERGETDPVNCLALHFSAQSPITADQVADRLSDGIPAIASIPMGDKLVLAVDAMTDAHAQVIAARLPKALR